MCLQHLNLHSWRTTLRQNSPWRAAMLTCVCTPLTSLKRSARTRIHVTQCDLTSLLGVICLQAFKLYAKFPSLRKNLYLLGAEQTLWQQGNQHEQEDVAPREELITACFPSGTQCPLFCFISWFADYLHLNSQPALFTIEARHRRATFLRKGPSSVAATKFTFGQAEPRNDKE